MKKNVLLFLFTILITLGFQSCNDENDKVGNTARIQLKLVDAPGDYEQVNIEIIDIGIPNKFVTIFIKPLY